MASSIKNPSKAPNLAAVLLVKRRLATKEASNIDENQALAQPKIKNIGAHSIEKLSYHQNISDVNLVPTTTTSQTVSPNPVRKAKQLDIELLDKKMKEIDRKQEQNTNETLDTWKGFDSFNYGFIADSQTQQSTPMQSVSTQQSTSMQSISTQQLTDTPRSNIEISSPQPSKENQGEEPIVNQEQVEKHPSPYAKKATSRPTSHLTEDHSHSKLSLKEIEPEKEVAEKQSPNSFSLHPIIDEKRVTSQAFEQSPTSILNHRPMKIFPDVKHKESPTDAYRTIQRSMERYRFYAW